MRITIVVLLQLVSFAIHAQNEITFSSPLKIVATEKIGSEIQKGATLYATGLFYSYFNGAPFVKISATNEEGSTISIEPRKILTFQFMDIDLISEAWDKHLLLNGTYFNLLDKGYQYDLRNELNNESIEYINTLSSYDRFFEDEYFEDYLYTLVNKIYEGIQVDKRPGNIYVKIIKDSEPNAFALPNGCVVISTGLLSTIQSEDELVGVLAHEIAHFALDHQVLNYNKEVERQKRAEFWATFATGVAAGADIYLASTNRNHIPGVLTASTAIAASAFSYEVLIRLGVQYNHIQETEADLAAADILEVLQYDKYALSAALMRIRDYCVLTGNYIALSLSGSHPSLDSRISKMGIVSNLDKYTQPNFLKKVSLITSYNAWLELWGFAHHKAAMVLASRNISNGVGTESDYIVKAIVQRRISNTIASNEEVISLLSKAKSLNITPYIIISKEEGITYLRFNKKIEAKKSFQEYLTKLNELQTKFETNQLEDEIEWTRKMIFKVDSL